MVTPEHLRVLSTSDLLELVGDPRLLADELAEILLELDRRGESPRR